MIARLLSIIAGTVAVASAHRFHPEQAYHGLAPSQWSSSTVLKHDTLTLHGKRDIHIVAHTAVKTS
jgi:hypothetical protein